MNVNHRFEEIYPFNDSSESEIQHTVHVVMGVLNFNALKKEMKMKKNSDIK